MAGISAIGIDNVLTVGLIFDDDADATVSKDLTTGPCKLYALNYTGTVAGYLHLWDNRNPTGGVTAMDYTFKCPNGQLGIVFPDGLNFSNGISWMYTTDKGTGAVTSPGAPVNIYATYKYVE